jgi:hypothetical protein
MWVVRRHPRGAAGPGGMPRPGAAGHIHGCLRRSLPTGAVVIRALAAMAAVAFSAVVSAAAVIRVPEQVGTIPAALFLAAPYDTILVAPGSYRVNLEWPAKQGIKLLSAGGPEVTVLDGGGDVQVIGIYTKVDTATVVRGFTIQNGHAEGQ